MRRRWNPTTITLTVLGGILLLAAIDMGQRMLAGPAPPPPPVNLPKLAQPPARVPSRNPLKIGQAAPDFELPDSSGKTRHLTGVVHGDTLLCFICGCANCMDLQTYMGILAKRMGRRAPAVVTVSTTAPERGESWIRDTGLPQTMLFEPREGPVMKMYAGHPCPRVYRLKEDRTIAWVSPSPDEMRNMEDIGHAVAANLGFPAERPGQNERQ
jgi:hypothetical protein